MSSPYVAGKDFPTQSGQEYDNLIAYGIKVIALPRFRLRTTSNEYYQLYCDVYLYDDNNPGGPDGHYENAPEPPYFIYRYVYWYCKIEASGPTTFRPVNGTNKLLPTTKVKQINGVTTTVLDKCGTYNIPDNINLKLTGYGNPAGWPATNAIPANFGWKPQIIDNIQTGTPENPISTPVYGPAGFPASGGATKSSYYDRDGSTNETTINGGGDGDTQPDQGDRDNAAGDANPSPTQEPLPPLNWFKRPTRWNPPLISTATGAYVPVDVGNRIDDTPPSRRSVLLGYNQAGQRVRAKGYLRQYIINAEEWRVNGGETEPVVDNPDWDNDSVMVNLEAGFNYGFRFHYNPEQVAMNTYPMNDIDPGFLTSGKEQAFPLGADGATISFPLWLNRVEDLSILRRGSMDSLIEKYNNLYKGNAGKDGKLYADNKDKWLRQDIRGIQQRGTGYDLEFIYRTAMGRPFPTALRGDTADLGVILGLPMQLKLNKHLNYVGRLTQLSYTHVMFTQDMIPMLTVVNLGFTRVPDAQTFEGAAP